MSDLLVFHVDTWVNITDLVLLFISSVVYLFVYFIFLLKMRDTSMESAIYASFPFNKFRVFSI